MGNQRQTPTQASVQQAEAKATSAGRRKPYGDELELLHGLGSNRAMNRMAADGQGVQPRQGLQHGPPRFRGLSGELAGGAKPQGLVIQPKLVMGQPNDKYEREADRVAERVVRELNNPKTIQPDSAQTMQRKLIPDEEEKKLQTKPMPQLQSGATEVMATPELENTIQQMRGRGQPLPDFLREPMERAFRADFSQVKIHTNSPADKLNKGFHASAFTTGKDIFFRQGSYDSSSSQGQRLIAHELAHIVQQNRITQLRGNAESRTMLQINKPTVQRQLEVDETTKTKLDEFLEKYKLKMTYDGNQAGFSKVKKIESMEISKFTRLKDAIEEFLKLVNEIIDGDALARIRFGKEQRYSDVQEIKQDYFTSMRTNVNPKTERERFISQSIYALGALGHEIYENYIAAKNAPSFIEGATPAELQAYWAAAKDPTSGYQQAHDAAIERESEITKKGELGERIGQFRMKEGGIALFEEGVMVTHLRNSKWIEVNKYTKEISFNATLGKGAFIH
jgi:hypothetical protein